MKKIFIICTALLILNFSGCSTDESSEQESTLESISETAAVTETIQETTKMELPTEAATKEKKLNLGKTDEWSFNSRLKFLYFTEDGRYYPVETSSLTDEDFIGECRDAIGRSTDYKLCFDDGNEQTIIDGTRNCASYYCDGEYIYIHKSKYDDDDNEGGIYKVNKDGIIKIIDDPEDDYISAVCFTNEHIYYSISGRKNHIVYQTDYDGNNTECIFDNPTEIWKMTVYNDKIWFDEYNCDLNKLRLKFYDLKTGDIREFDGDHMGYINNNYMYYDYYDDLKRVNLSDYKIETVFNLTGNKYLRSFDFYENYILYSDGNSVYKYNENEDTLIFSAENYFENKDKYYVDDIQCQDGKIFIKVGMGAFYRCIMEIDIDGNVIELIHED